MKAGVRTIRNQANTRYYAVKRSILGAMKFFIENDTQYFVNAEMSYTNFHGEVVDESVLVRREVLSQFVGFDFVKHKKRFNMDVLAPKTKEEVDFVWRVLKKNSKSLKIVKDER